MNLPPHTVYAIRDKGTGEVVYVGRTYYRPSALRRRLDEHRWASKKGKTRFHRWLREAGREVTIECLQQCDAWLNHAPAAELEWIREFRKDGQCALNTLPYDDGLSHAGRRKLESALDSIERDRNAV